jgi:hypothetical protein
MASCLSHLGVFSVSRRSASTIGLLILLALVASREVLAQSTGSIGPDHATAPSGNDEVPPGGCTPIGVTASGEIVFPLTCRAFLERRRGPIDEPKSAAPIEKPAQAEKAEAPVVIAPAQVAAPAKSEPVVQPPAEADPRSTSSIDEQERHSSRETRRSSHARHERHRHERTGRRRRRSSSSDDYGG